MNRFSVRGRKSGFTLVEIMIVVLIIGILLAIAIPNFMKARETSRTNSCIANLKQIDAAIQQYAMDNKKSGTDTVGLNDLTTGVDPYIRSEPECPSGGDYSTTTVSEKPSCNIDGHELP